MRTADTIVIATASAAPLRLPGGRAAAEDDARSAEAIDRAMSGRPAAVRLVEGDVLLRRALPDWVGRLRAAGTGAVWVQTTGLPLLRPQAAARVRALGVTGVIIPLFGADADGHDYLVGQPGAHAAALRAMRAALAAGLTVELLAPLSRPTFRTLDRLVARALPLGVGAVWLRPLVADGSIPAAWAPPTPLVRPILQRAAGLVLASRRQLWLSGWGACELDDLDEPVAATARRWLVIDGAAAGAPGLSRLSRQEQAGACTTCGTRAHCPGPLAAPGIAAPRLAPRRQQPGATRPASEEP